MVPAWAVATDGREQTLNQILTVLDGFEGNMGVIGADLENLMNESAILTARPNKKAITIDEILPVSRAAPWPTTPRRSSLPTARRGMRSWAPCCRTTTP